MMYSCNSWLATKRFDYAGEGGHERLIMSQAEVRDVMCMEMVCYGDGNVMMDVM